MSEVKTEIAPDLGDIGREEAPAIADEVESPSQPTDEVKVDDSISDEKDLKSRYTKITQELAETKKRYSKDLEELSAYRQMYAQQAQKAQEPKQKTAEEFDKMTDMEKFNYLVDSRVSEIVKPYISKIAQLEGIITNFTMENAAKMRNSFLEANPDAAPYEEQIAEIMVKHNMTDPNEAWDFLKSKLGLTKDEAKQEVIREFQIKKDASKLIKPVSTPSTPTKEKVSSIEDAFNETLKELGTR